MLMLCVMQTPVTCGSKWQRRTKPELRACWYTIVELFGDFLPAACHTYGEVATSKIPLRIISNVSSPAPFHCRFDLRLDNHVCCAFDGLCRRPTCGSHRWMHWRLSQHT